MLANSNFRFMSQTPHGWAGCTTIVAARRVVRVPSIGPRFTCNGILPITVSGSPCTLAETVKSQRPAIVRGALKAYTPGPGLGSGTIAEAMEAIPSGDMSMRVWTIAASVTGFPLGLCTRRTATVARLDLGVDRLEHVVVGTGNGRSREERRGQKSGGTKGRFPK